MTGALRCEKRSGPSSSQSFPVLLMSVEGPSALRRAAAESVGRTCCGEWRRIRFHRWTCVAVRVSHDCARDGPFSGSDDDGTWDFLATHACSWVAPLLRTKTEISAATELPRNFAPAHHAHYLATDLAFNDWAPRDEAEAPSIVDHGKAAAGELR